MDDRNLAALTTEIIAGYLGANRVSPSALPELITSVHRALKQIADPPPSPASETSQPGRPDARQVRRSIRPDALISFLDGKPYKTLRRHLSTHGHTPESYRQAYGLPADYPMVAPSYSATRSQMAKDMGLGGGRPGKRRSRAES